MKMRRIVIIEEHSHRNSEKIGDRRQWFSLQERFTLSTLRQSWKAGKKRTRQKRTRQFSKIDIPQEALVAEGGRAEPGRLFSRPAICRNGARRGARRR
jgi:hypothetical protein